jgi:hypothetical protein
MMALIQQGQSWFLTLQAYQIGSNFEKVANGGF